MLVSALTRSVRAPRISTTRRLATTEARGGGKSSSGKLWIFLLSDQEDVESPAPKLLVSCAIHLRAIPEYVPIPVVAS